jgi:hypothetical protein
VENTSYVIAAPETMTAAATDLASIGSTLSAAHMAAAPATVALVPAAADEVSAGIAHLFSRHAHDYQALAGRAAASQAQFVENLKASAASYASAEAAAAASLRALSASAGLYPAANAGLENLVLNLVIFELGLQLGALIALQQLANSFSFLTPLFQLAGAALYLEIIVTFGILFKIFPSAFS